MLRTLLIAGLMLPCLAANGAETPAAVAAADLQRDYWQERGCPAGASRCQWFRDAKFGAIIHFGVYSELGGYYQGKGPYRPAEQIMGLGDRRATIPPSEYLRNVAASFNPIAFDANAWVRQMKDAGQRYVVITTKHHDGFCMFDTQTTDFNVVDATPFGRDVVKELAEACHQQDMRFCLYYSIGDWSAKEVMHPRFADYGQYMRAQLKELLTGYGKVDAVWFDNYWYVNHQYTNDEPHARELYNYVRQLQPETIVNDRCGVGVQSTHGDYATPENQLKGSLQSRYFEVVMTCTDDDNWGWVRGATNYRKPGEIVRNIVDSVSKGGNFVLNIGPNGAGEFPLPQRELLARIGDWLSRNGEALYDAVPAPEVDFVNSRDAYATQSADGGNVYLHIANWPEVGPLEVRMAERSGGLPSASMLAAGLPLPAISDAEEGGKLLRIDRPQQTDDYLTVIKLKF